MKDLYSSYKDLPLSLYQIQTKYRDEARPRAGLLRGREFVMKDSYSFDIDDEGLQKSYEAHRDAYIKIFNRLGFSYVIVQAMSGAMGGSASEEFLAVAENGEDTFVRSPGSYAASVESGPGDAPPPLPTTMLHAASKTLRTPTIETLVCWRRARFPRQDRRWQAADTLKSSRTHGQGRRRTRQPLVIGLPGDPGDRPKRLAAQWIPSRVEPFSDDDFAAHPLLVKGYIGPAFLAARPIKDPLPGRSPGGPGNPLVTGANEARPACLPTCLPPTTSVRTG